MKLKFPTPKQHKTHVQGVSMTLHQKAQLDRIAEHYGVNRSQVVQQMIEQAYSALPKEAQNA